MSKTTIGQFQKCSEKVAIFHSFFLIFYLFLICLHEYFSPEAFIIFFLIDYATAKNWHQLGYCVLEGCIVLNEHNTVIASYCEALHKAITIYYCSTEIFTEIKVKQNVSQLLRWQNVLLFQVCFSVRTCETNCFTYCIRWSIVSRGSTVDGD